MKGQRVVVFKLCSIYSALINVHCTQHIHTDKDSHSYTFIRTHAFQWPYMDSFTERRTTCTHTHTHTHATLYTLTALGPSGLIEKQQESLHSSGSGDKLMSSCASRQGGDKRQEAEHS